MEKRRKLEARAIRISEERKRNRTKQSKLEEEEEKQRKQIAQGIEDELKTKGHVINSENTSINVDTQNGQKESSSNLEKESIPQKEAINNASVDENSSNANAIQAMQIAAADQRKRDEERLKLAIQSNDAIEKNGSKNLVSDFTNSDVTVGEKILEHKLQELVKVAIASGLFNKIANNQSNNGKISLEYLKTCIDMVKGEEKLKKAEVEWLIHKLDSNGDQEIDYRELLSFAYGKDLLPNSLHDSEERAYDGTNKAREVDISITEKPVSNYQDEKDVDLEFRVSATAKKLKQIFLSVVSSGRASDFREIFEAIDTDNSGAITRKEFLGVLDQIDFKISMDVHDALLDRFDVDGNGTINYRDFLRFCSMNANGQDSELGQSMQAVLKVRKALQHLLTKGGDEDGNNGTSNKYDGIRDVQSIFNDMDKDGAGTIDITEFRDAMLRWGTGLSENEITIFGERFDYDGDGEVDYNEFLRFIYNDRQDVRWNGDMTTVRKLRKIYSTAVSLNGEQDLMIAFKRYDSSKDGLIKNSDFRKVLEDTWLELSRDDIDDVIRRFQIEKDGRICYEKFINLCGGDGTICRYSSDSSIASGESSIQDSYVDPHFKSTRSNMSQKN